VVLIGRRAGNPTSQAPVLASNAAHLAKLLKKSNYPGRKEAG
jgi:hypothetical protein